MDPIPALVRRLWDMWDLRLLVLLSLALQIILSLFGNRRKYILSRWISILVWLAYLMADWAATVALGKLSDAQVGYDNGNALRAIWAPLLLLHLGGPDTITAYSLEDNHLWMRHFLGLVVQLSVAVYVILMSWKHSWFSIMSIPALVAGFIKYGERTWVLLSVSRDKFGEIVPFGNEGRRSNVGNNNTSEDKSPIHVLCIAHRCVKAFKKFTQFYDMKNNAFENRIEVDDISQFWKVIEVEMGLMFDLLYTKASINFTKEGWILRCFTFSCTVAVLIGLILQLSSTGEDGEKWHKVDIVITAVLLVGALALEIYAIISLYLFSDWAMLWLIKNNRAKQLIQFRGKKPSWLFFLPKQYRCEMMGQFDLLDYWVNKPHEKVVRRKLWSLLGIKTWVEEYYRMDMLKKYVYKTAVIGSSLLFDPILHFTRPHLNHRRAVEEVYPFWKEFFNRSLEKQITYLYITTEICYNLEMDGDTTHDAAADQNNRESIVSQQHTMPGPSDSSLLWEENRKLCRTLSRYMTYLLVMRSSLLPIAASDNFVSDFISGMVSIVGGSVPNFEGVQDIREACRGMYQVRWYQEFVDQIMSNQKDVRWEMLKLVWVRMLCYAVSKGQKNEHFRQLSQGGEFLTFLWFFLPQSTKLDILP